MSEIEIDVKNFNHDELSEITNPEILDTIERLDKGEYEGKMLEVDFNKIKNPEDLKNAIRDRIIPDTQEEPNIL